MTSERVHLSLLCANSFNINIIAQAVLHFIARTSSGVLQTGITLARQLYHVSTPVIRCALQSFRPHKPCMWMKLYEKCCHNLQYPTALKEHHNQKNKRTDINYRFFFQNGSFIFSRAVTRQVSSAQESLTSVFGMGTGGSSPQSPPYLLFSFYLN